MIRPFDMALSSPFIGYDSYLPETRSEPVFLSLPEQKRILRYGLLASLYHNFNEYFMKGQMPRPKDKEPIETAREYGDSQVIVDTIRDAVIAGEVTLSDFVSDSLWEVWNDNKLDKLITDNELLTGMLGDGFYHFYSRRSEQWRVEAIDPRFAVIQTYERELRHVLFWSMEVTKDDTFVTALEYVLTPSEGDFVCYWRQVRWRVQNTNERKAEDLISDFPFNYKILADPNDLLSPQLADTVQGEDLSPAFNPAGVSLPWYPFMDNKGKQVDFIPVIHIANINSGSVYGLSDLHGSIQTLIDLKDTNGSLRDAERLLGIPPVSVEDAKDGFADLKSGFDVGGKKEIKQVRLQPGLLLNGKVSLVDVSKLLVALLEGKKQKVENVYAVSHVPEIAAAPSSLRVVSGEALKVVLRPLILLAERKRIDRRSKFTLMMKFFAKLYGENLELTREQPTIISFGDIEQWLASRFADQILLAETSQVITKEEARTHLIRGGVLDKPSLDPNWEPPASNSTLEFGESMGQGMSDTDNQDEGDEE